MDSYEREGKTLREIGDEYRVSHTTIRDILRRRGVEMREPGRKSASYESGIMSFIRLDERVSKRWADSKMSATEFWVRELTWDERSRLIALSCSRDGLFSPLLNREASP